MSSVAVSKRIAALTADFEALLAESVDGSAAERAEAAFDWETFKRRCAAMDHRVVGSLAEVPIDELGESSLATALSTLLRISASDANRRIKDAGI
jgi:ABC-type taurine transport system substrate-binding protein